MVELKEAIGIAVKEMNNPTVGGALDIGDRWAVMFDMGEHPEPGICGIVGVNKETGRTDFITIPPMENIELLECGTIVYEKEHFFSE